MIKPPRVITYISSSTIKTVTALYVTLLIVFVFTLSILPNQSNKIASNDSGVIITDRNGNEPTVTVSPTATITTSLSPTTTPTTPPEPTAATTTAPTVSTTPTEKPTATTAPTTPPTSTPTSINAMLNLKLLGVGPGAPDNTNPHRPVRVATLYFFDPKNNMVKTTTGNVSYNGSTGLYSGNITVKDLPKGKYRTEAKLDNTLQAKVPGIVSPELPNVTLPNTTLVSGDVDQNNILDLKDYNVLIYCFGPKSCSGNQKLLVDFNADGLVNEKDLNIILRSFAIQQGD